MSRAFNWQDGSVRALIVLILVVTLCLCIAYSLITKQTLAFPETFITLVVLAVNWYFDKRRESKQEEPRIKG